MFMTCKIVKYVDVNDIWKSQEYTFLCHLKNVKNILFYDIWKTSRIYLCMTLEKHQ